MFGLLWLRFSQNGPGPRFASLNCCKPPRRKNEMLWFNFLNFVPERRQTILRSLDAPLQQSLRSAPRSWHLKSRWQHYCGSRMSKQAAHRLAARLTDPSAVFLKNVHTVGITAEAPPRRQQHAHVFTNPRMHRELRGTRSAVVATDPRDRTFSLSHSTRTCSGRQAEASWQQPSRRELATSWSFALGYARRHCQIACVLRRKETLRASMRVVCTHHNHSKRRSAPQAAYGVITKPRSSTN